MDQKENENTQQTSVYRDVITTITDNYAAFKSQICSANQQIRES